MPPFNFLHRRSAWIAVAGVFLAVWGAKAWMIFHYGSDMPFWDEWPKQGEMITAAYYEKTLKIGDFFVPHNEHRIAPTLLLNLGLTVVSGQWDTRVECLVNAALFAAIAAGMVVWAWRRESPGWGLLLALFWAAWAVIPLDWENVLVGFQSQFYFLIGFSLVAIWGLASEGGPPTRRWWAGLVAAALASVSMGSGFLCLVPVAILVAWRAVLERRLAWGGIATLGLAAAGTAIGWMTRGKAPWHQPIHAHALREFLLYCDHCLRWPFSETIWRAAIVWIPWLVLTLRCLIDIRGTRLARSWFVVGGGLWILIQIAAVAYARGAGAGDPASRYDDLFVTGLAINFLAWAGWPGGVARHLLALAWTGVLLAVAGTASVFIWHDLLPARRSKFQQYEWNVRAYCLTGDAHYMVEPQIPYPDPDWLRRMLDRPTLRRVLPASVRPPLAVQSDPAGGAGFRHNWYPPGTATLSDRDVWNDAGAPAGAAWRSRPIARTDYPYWEIEMTGAPNGAGSVLRLETAGGAASAPIAPTRPPGDTWRAAYVRLPGGTGPVTLRAQGGGGPAFGFRAPVEVSALSEFGRRLCRQAVWVWSAGAALLAAATLGWGSGLRVRARRPQSGASSPPATG